MVAGINNASNSPANKKKTTNVAWNPLKKARDNVNLEIQAGEGNTIPSARKREQEIEDLEKRLRGY